MSQIEISPSSAPQFLVFQGSYTKISDLAHMPKDDVTEGEGVRVFAFNSETAKLAPLSTIESLNPAVLNLHPSHKQLNTLYVQCETIKEKGYIEKIDWDIQNLNGQLSFVSGKKKSRFTCNGKSTCYFRISPSKEYGIAINYWEGSVDLVKMDPRTGQFVKSENGKMIRQHIEQSDLSTKKEARRQVKDRVDHWKHRFVGAHAHSVHWHRDWVYIPDLGENSVYRYLWQEDAKIGEQLKYLDQFELKEGAGPRHMVFHSSLPIAYVSNELNSTVSVLKINDKDGSLSELQSLSTIPPPPSSESTSATTSDEVSSKKENDGSPLNTGTDESSSSSIMASEEKEESSSDKEEFGSKSALWSAQSYVAEVAFDKSEQFIYVSNRGHDSLAVFKVDLEKSGTLSFLSSVPTHGKCPRHFGVSPDNRFIIVANQDANNLVIFERNLKTGALKKVNEIHSNAPNFVLFHDMPIQELLSK